MAQLTDTTAVATFPDGSQVLVTTWPNGVIEVATRAHPTDMWSPPRRARSE